MSSPLSPQNTTSSSVSPLRRKTMSVTQTYYLAHTARSKLSHEASKSEHDLFRLVHHANLLDSLMIELAEAEQEQESWFNQSVKAATKTEEPKHIQWADTVIEEQEDWDVSSDSSDSDSDFDDEDGYQMSPAQQIDEDEEEYYEDDGEEDYAALTLTPSPSHSAASSPPELSHDSDSDSEDDTLPSPPATSAIPSFTKQQRQQIATTSFYSQPSKAEESEPTNFFEDIYSTAQQAIVSEVSVF